MGWYYGYGFDDCCYFFVLYCLSYILYVNIVFLPVQLFQCVGHIGEVRQHFFKSSTVPKEKFLEVCSPRFNLDVLY